MKEYKTKEKIISGTSFTEINRVAKTIFRKITAKTKRTPYVRSKYFNKEKIFLTIFWRHLYEKSEKDRVRRLRYYHCAIDTLINSNIDPETRENFAKKDELLHRFYGVTKNKEQFVAQVKENKRTKRKDFISVYPI